MQLNDIKAIVTGGASGMGRAFTLELARAGADVVVADLDEDKMAAGGRAEAADLAGTVHARRGQRRRRGRRGRSMINGAHEEMGGLNCLVNNAGIFRDGLLGQEGQGDRRGQEACP